MKFIKNFFQLFVFGLTIYISFNSLQPSIVQNTSVEHFSIKNALNHVNKIAKQPHFTGTKAHANVRNYLISELENLGLKAHIQQDFSTTHNNGLSIAIPENIIAKIEGEDPDEPALVLMSHYDSAVHSAIGAADAASGVAAILEAVRAFKQTGTTPKQDVIILFTDTEEIGLNGANLFVGKHPWAKNVGLVVNFEARGTSGPSSMILEVNGGNKNLIQHFANAQANNPFANSLMYSVYKLLPNDTDSTIFRENANVPSMFFAFIDKHFYYHTQLDTVENLDLASLNQQGEYALSMLNYFSSTSLKNLHTEEDHVYFNFPFLGIIHFSSKLILLLIFLCLSSTLVFNYIAIQQHKITLRSLFKSFTYALFCIVLAFGLGFLGWKTIAYFNPEHQLILQGFPYNAKSIILAFSLLTSGLFLYFFKFFSLKVNAISLLSVGIYLWVLISIFALIYLPGASYLIIPALFGALILAALVLFKFNNQVFHFILSIPLIFIVLPFVYFFPVGLGIASIFISCVLLILILLLLSPLLYNFRLLQGLNFLLISAGVFFLLKAHLYADFTKNQPRPSSLNYLYNADQNQSYWVSYDAFLSNWNAPYFKQPTNNLNSLDLESKYSSRFKHFSKADPISIPTSAYQIKLLEKTESSKHYLFQLKPTTDVNRIEVFFNKVQNVSNIKVNNEAVEMKKHSSSTKKYLKFFTYHVSNKETLDVEFTVDNQTDFAFEIIESSFNLHEHKQLQVEKRPVDEMPMPFVINDATIVTYTIQINE